MKKILSMILVCALLMGCVLALSSCVKMIFGTYKAEFKQNIGIGTLDFGSITYEFKGNKVTVIKEDLKGDLETRTASYKITEVEENVYEITFNYLDEEGTIETCSFVEGEENGVKYITIDGIKCIKQ